MNHYLKKYGFLIIFLSFVIFSFQIPFKLQATHSIAKNNIKKSITNKVRELNIPILCYHRIIPNPSSPYDLSPEQLEAHFLYFKANGYTPITASQFLEYRKKPALFPEKPIVLTFDDGTKSHYTQVLPMLKKHGFKATFYIFTNAMNGSKERWLSWDEVREISRAGMDIGSHTVSHPYLTSRDKMDDGQYQAWLEKELFQSKKILEEKLNTPIKTLAYPFGLYDSQVEATSKRAGYAGMLSINMGLNGSRENPYRMKRRLMVNSIGPKSLGNILTEKVLDLGILSPADTTITSALPVIRFRVKTPLVETARLEISKYQASLKPDPSGIYTFEIPGKLRAGFQTIIIRGRDSHNNSYLNSWSFYYRPGQ